MATGLTGTLEQLTTTFTVKDIMTPKSRLRCARNAEEAPAVSAANPDFSVIPINEHDELTAYFERDAGRAQPIEVGNLLSDGTTLLHLVEILQQREFSFVLSQQHINGYVHYSDLNHQIVKWTFYVLLEAVERLALEALRPGDERAYLQKRLSPERYTQVAGLYKRAGDNGRNLMTYLNVADILRLAVSAEALQLEETSIKMMKDVRDWASHVLCDLNPEHALRNLATVKRECLRLLGATDEGEVAAASA